MLAWSMIWSTFVLPMTLDTMTGSFIFILHKKGSYPHIKESQGMGSHCTDPEFIWQHPDVACSYRMRAGALCEGKWFLKRIYRKKKILKYHYAVHYSDKHYLFCPCSE